MRKIKFLFKPLQLKFCYVLLRAVLTDLTDQGPTFCLASACCTCQKMVATVIGVTVRNNACEIKSSSPMSFFSKEEILLRSPSTGLLPYIVG